jgi:DNA polymerase III epsilon subunit-like protein
MRQIVIAFSTTGPSPKKGDRISELVAVEQANGLATGKTLHLVFQPPEKEGGKATFAAQFGALDDLVGDAQVVVHHAGNWRKFLRIELRDAKTRGARRLLKQTVDVYRWAHQRYPKHRKDVAALAKRLCIVVPADLTGLRASVEQLRLIAREMKSTEDATYSSQRLAAVSMSPEKSTAHASIIAKLGALWRSLTG